MYLKNINFKNPIKMSLDTDIKTLQNHTTLFSSHFATKETTMTNS